MSKDFNDLLKELKGFSKKDINFIKQAYDFACIAHDGQYRCSGEPFVTHPLNVAIKLARWNADVDTICAGLLHDTIEDTSVTYEDIEHTFNNTIAYLVDGVTKMADFRFSSKKERNLANTRKIITSITKDIRIILIKIADREHNMETLDSKPVDKQKGTAFETLHIFAPIAGSVGMYRIKNKLEDLSLKYLEPDEYKRIEDDRNSFYYEYRNLLIDVSKEIKKALSDNGIPCEIRERIKSVYSIYLKEREGKSFNSIQDLLSLNIIVNQIIDCYESLCYIHELYNPINQNFRDYIPRPFANQYRSIHSSLIVRDNTILQAQIRTPEMDKQDNMGICSYWEKYGKNAYKKMQKDLKKKYPFYKTLETYENVYKNDEDFMFHVEAELLSVKIYVYNSLGEVVEIPYGSTIEKYLVNQGIDVEDVEECYVNGKKVNKKTILKDSDMIFVKIKQQKELKLLK